MSHCTPESEFVYGAAKQTAMTSTFDLSGLGPGGVCCWLQVPGLGIEPLGAALEAFGYSLKDFYTFPRTHLLAAW